MSFPRTAGLTAPPEHGDWCEKRRPPGQREVHDGMLALHSEVIRRPSRHLVLQVLRDGVKRTVNDIDQGFRLARKHEGPCQRNGIGKRSRLRDDFDLEGRS